MLSYWFMKNLTNKLLIICLLGFLSACQAPVAEEPALDMQAIKAEIQAMEDAYAEASNTKNAEAQVAYYADDAQSLAPNRPTIVGKAAILAYTKEEMAEDTSNDSTIRFEVVDLFADGDLLVEVGKSITTKNDGTETTGKYMSVFEKINGKYICIRDIYNSDQKENNDADASTDAEE